MSLPLKHIEKAIDSLYLLELIQNLISDILIYEIKKKFYYTFVFVYYYYYNAF